MSLLDILLVSALIVESLFLTVCIYFYRKEKQKARLEKIKRVEEIARNSVMEGSLLPLDILCT